MKKLLYITVNSKDEAQSTSKTVGRRLVNAILEKLPDVQLEELDLYKDHIPQLKACYFEDRNAIVSAEAKSGLSTEEQNEVDTIIKLCDQFRNADIYVVELWNMSFPTPLKVSRLRNSGGKTINLKIISLGNA